MSFILQQHPSAGLSGSSPYHNIDPSRSPQSSFNPHSPNSTYSLPGVLHFLQSEWRKFETERNLWEIERENLKSKISILEGERRALEFNETDLLKRIKLLEYALRHERTRVNSTNASLNNPSLQHLQADKSSLHRNASNSTLKTLNDTQNNGSNVSGSSVPVQRLTNYIRTRMGTARSREILKEYLKELSILSGSSVPTTLNGSSSDLRQLGSSASLPSASGITGSMVRESSGMVVGNMFGSWSGVPLDAPMAAPAAATRMNALGIPSRTSSAGLPHLSSSVSSIATATPQSSTTEAIDLDVDPDLMRNDDPPVTNISSPFIHQVESHNVPSPEAKPSSRDDPPSPDENMLAENDSELMETAALDNAKHKNMAVGMTDPSLSMDLLSMEGAQEKSLSRNGGSLLDPYQSEIQDIDPITGASHTVQSPERISRKLEPPERDADQVASTPVPPLTPKASIDVEPEDTSKDVSENDGPGMVMLGLRRSDTAVRAVDYAAYARSAREEKSSDLGITDCTQESATNDSEIDTPQAHETKAQTAKLKSEREDRERQSYFENGTKPEISTMGRRAAGALNMSNDKPHKGEKLWRLRLTLRNHLDSVLAVTFHSVKPWLVSASLDGAVRLWDLSSRLSQPRKKAGSDLHPFLTYRGHSSGVASIEVEPEAFVGSGGKDLFGKKEEKYTGRLFSGGMDGSIRIWKFMKKAPYSTYDKSVNLGSLGGHSNVVWGLRHHPLHSILASHSADGTVKLWDTSEGASTSPQLTLQHLDIIPTAVDFLPQHNAVLVGYRDSRVRHFDLETGKLVRTFDSGLSSPIEPNTSNGTSDGSWTSEDEAAGQVNCLRAMGEMNMAVSGDEARFIKFYDIRTGQLIDSQTGHTDSVTSMSHYDNTMVTGGHDGSLRFWDLRKNVCVQDLLSAHRRKGDEGIWDVSLRREGWCASAGADGVVKVFIY